MKARHCSRTWETVHIASDWNLSALRFPVQWVNRPNNPTDPQPARFSRSERTNCQRIVRKGQQVAVLPAGIQDHREGHLDL